MVEVIGGRKETPRERYERRLKETPPYCTMSTSAWSNEMVKDLQKTEPKRTPLEQKPFSMDNTDMRIKDNVILGIGTWSILISILVGVYALIKYFP